MANKQDVKVNLLFEASTQSAINNLRQLGKELDNISSNTAIGVDDGALQRAVESAQQLQVHLQNAVDVDTGKIDLIKFNQSLKTAKTDLRTLSTDLQGMGTQGQQAFIKLAKAISIAETPVVKLNKKVADLGKTLLNTAKWQISSEVIHGVTGMLNEAVRHAEDLNAALSDIRIVTGASAQEMAHFANNASVAARELNTTTTEYAKAALIFYQQGLSGSEVTKRTDTVIKLAQVTGQSAKMVSDQMTAIWNNFDDGTKSLERYADVLTKLGAITAASTDEISEGLEKFAAVAETVGLEYETAAAAVATVVDKTRQSADVVGTSFKTIFARMQNLELGETLEDGVNLTKYSKALEDVGVKVLDAKGQMRDMDDILSDLGEKWNGLGKTTQTAIAQTVGGIRQYNQMMALMNNWGDVQKNIEAAKESGGELAKQASIWSESYEAAQERLTQAKNELYESFVNDKFLIILQDLGSVLVDRFADFTESIGGAIPLVLMLVGLFSKMLFPVLRNAFGELKQNFDVVTGKAQKEINKVQSEMRAMMQETLDDPGVETGLKRQIELSYDLSKARELLAEKSKHMSAIEREEAEMRLHVAESLTSEIQQQLAQQSELEKQADRIKSGLFSNLSGKDQRAIKNQSKEHSAREVLWQEERDRLKNTEEGKATLSEKYTTKTIAEDGTEIFQVDWAAARAQFEKEFDEFLANGEAKLEKKAQLLKNKLQLDETKESTETKKQDAERQFAELDKKAQPGEVMNTEEIAKWEQLQGDIQAYSNALSEIDEKSKTISKEIEELSGTETERTQQMIAYQEKYNAEKEKTVELSEAIVGTSTTKNAFSQFNQAESSVSGSGKASEIMTQAAMKQLGAMPSDISVDDINMEVSIESFTKALQVSSDYQASLKKLTTVSTEWKKNQDSLIEATKKSAQASKDLKKADIEYGAAQSKVAALAISGKKHTLEYVKAKERLHKADRAMNKAHKEQQSANEMIKKSLDGLLGSLKQTAAQLGLDEKQTENFTNRIQELSNESNITEQNLKEVTTIISEMVNGTANASAGIDTIVDDMGQLLIESGASEEAIDALVEQFRELGTLTPEIEQKLNLIKKQLKDLDDQPVSIGDKIEKAATGFATLAGQVTAAFGAINSIFDAFDEGNTPLETFMGLLTGLSVLIPVVVAGTKALAGATLYQKIISAAALPIMAARKKKHEEEAAAEGKETAAKWANTAAELANQIAKGPVGIAIAAAAVVAIGVTLAAITAHTKGVEKNTKAIEENNKKASEAADNATEAADAWAKESTAMNEVVSEYHKLTEGTEDYQEATQKVLDQIPNLANSYRDYAKAIGETTVAGQELLDIADKMEKAGNKGEKGIQEALVLQAEADLKVAEDAKAKALAAKESTMTLIANNLGRQDDTTWERNAVRRHVGGVGTQKNVVQWDLDGDGKNESLNEEEAAVDALMYSFGLGRNTEKKTGFDVKLRTDNSENFMKDYESLLQAASIMENSLGDALDNSDTYREVKEIIDASKEQYEEMKKYSEEVDKYNALVETAKLQKEAVSGNSALDITKVSSVRDYENYKFALMEATKDNADAQKAAIEWLESQNMTKLYADAFNRAESLGGELKELIAHYSDEELQFFLDINTNVHETVYEVETEVKRLKQETEAKEIQLKINTTTEALDTLKEDGMTEEDWTKLRESGIDWSGITGDGKGTFADFINSDYKLQKKYLQDLKKQQEEQLQTQLKNNAEYLKERINSQQLSVDAEKAAKKELQIIEEQLEVKSKIFKIEAENRRRERIEALGLKVDDVDELTKKIQENSYAMRDNKQAAEDMATGLLQLSQASGLTPDEVFQYSNILSGLDVLHKQGEGFLHDGFTKLQTVANETGLELKDLLNITQGFDTILDEEFKDKSTEEKALSGNISLSGENAINLATQAAEAANKYEIPIEELIIQAKTIKEVYAEQKMTIEEALNIAIQNQRMNQGLSKLASNWTSWKKELIKADHTTTDYTQTITEVTDAIKDLIGATEDFELPQGFLDTPGNMQLIEEAANGSATAINKLGLSISSAQISGMEAKTLYHSFAEAYLEDNPWIFYQESFEQAKETVLKGIEDIQNNLDSLEPGKGIEFLSDEWITSLNNMALATNMSVDEMNALLSEMGVSAKVDVVNVKTTMNVPKYQTTEKIEENEDGTRTITSFTKQIGTEPVEGEMPIASISTDGNPDTPDIKFIGKSGISDSAKSTGGSTTKPKHVEDKKETKKRYETIDSKMEDKANIIADTERSLDTMYGADRILQMKAVNDLLKDEVELLREKNTEAKEYLKTDAGSVTTAFSAVGITDVTFDENGNVQFPEGKDIEDYFETLDNDYAAAVSNHNKLIDTAWTDGVITADEQANIDASKEALDEKSKKIDEARAAWDKYLETLGIVNDTEDKKVEKENEIKANNYQAMVDELTLATEKNADALQEYDYYLNKVAEDYYNMAEAAGYMQNKLNITQSNLTAYGNHYASLEAKHSAGEISDADYYAGLAETKDAIYGELEALQSLDAEMLEYYGNTLSMAGEEIGKYTEKIDQLSSVLDHYQSLLSIIGKENDFESIGVVLSGIASTAKDAKDVAKAEYEFYAKQAEERKAAMDAATNDAAKEALKKEWEAAEAAANEAQDRMLSSTAEWAEAMKAVTENKLKDYAQTLEKALTGGTSFDDLTTSMERASSLQEEYLTSTNQIYETSKMMRDTQKAIDETTNQVAKNKLKAFMEETKQLQNQDKLSQHQLDIHQAEYELLMAEIALEEAQSAKSTVRLQRDAEGNFGYVYTADSSQVADAEQKVADAQNALYNKQLEGANNYTQKYQQTLSEMYDTMSTLQEQYLSGEITSEEEYNQKMLEAKQYYFQKLQDFSELYQISTTDNSAVIADAWSSDFADMTASTETWKIAVEDYANNCASAFTGWKDVIIEVEKETGDLSTKVSNITSKSKELADELTKDNGVIDKLEVELNLVVNITNAYEKQRTTLLGLIETYEEYASAINTTLAGKKVITTITTEAKEDLTQSPPTGMATGGYTGDWGPEGKLAILHEKEIVLNAQDTENLLAAVGTLRVILNAIDTHSMSAQIGGMLSTPGFAGGSSEVLEQNVKIEASFPGVQDRNEIEEAFNNLINRASQYANRK